MKIIFDNEEEKQELIHYVCPSVLSRYLKDIGTEDCENGSCHECWEKGGLEMEVKEND